MGGASPPHEPLDCSVTSEDVSCDLLLDPTPISESIILKKIHNIHILVCTRTHSGKSRTKKY